MDRVFSQLGTTIFETMSALCRETGAINLGQGFPDQDGAPDVRAKAAEALMGESNQYPPMQGLAALRAAVSAHYQRFHDVAYDPGAEILITSGATEAIAATLFALIAPGDEVVVFEPAYDAYVPLVRRAGGIVRFAALRAPIGV